MDEELLNRQAPQSLEAEQSVLGSILIDSRCITEVVGVLRPEDFYLQQNREIYETIYTMFNFSQTIDPVTVLDKLKERCPLVVKDCVECLKVEVLKRFLVHSKALYGTAVRLFLVCSHCHEAVVVLCVPCKILEFGRVFAFLGEGHVTECSRRHVLVL